MKATITALTLALIAAATSVHAEEAAPSPSAWAFKGISLNSTPEEFRGLFPQGKCETYPDPSILGCSVETTLADKPSLLNVKYLDGRAVYVALEDIDYDQAMEGAHALSQKYTQPTSKGQVKVRMTFPGQSQMRLMDRPLWDAGDVKMYVDPANWTDDRRDRTYSALILVNEPKHNNEWIVRYNRKGKPAADI